MSGRISALKVQKRDRQRVNVYLDGEFAFGLSRITAAWLHIGQELSDEKINELQAQDASEAAYQRALKFLNYRARSSREVRRNLESHAVPEEVIEGVLERLQGSGLIDDTRFAQDWIENRSEFRPRSRRMLAYELRQRGLPTDQIDQALNELDDESLAYQAALKQARKLRELEWLEFRQKLSGFLARRGFAYQEVQSAVRRVWDEIQEQG
jgi:regulatory protein